MSRFKVTPAVMRYFRSGSHEKDEVKKQGAHALNKKVCLQVSEHRRRRVEAVRQGW